MTNGALSVLLGLSVTVLTGFGGYVATMELYCQAELQRLGQPCSEFLAAAAMDAPQTLSGMPAGPLSPPDAAIDPAELPPAASPDSAQSARGPRATHPESGAP
jgi:hypothetical protein